jgi:hypothetical protein
VFKIQGALHHKVGSLLPAEGQEPIYAQLYFYSPEEANAARMRRTQGLNSNSGLKQEVMNILDDVLRRNHAYIPLYKTAYERIKEQQRNHPDAPSEIYARITCEPGTDARRYNAPTANDVAAILPGDGSVVPDHRDIILHERGGPLRRIHETHPSYQPLLYVLLFPYGEDGYHTKIPLALQDDTDDEPWGEREAEEGEGNQPKRRQMVSLLEYYAYCLHQRVTDSIHIFHSGLLLQQWIVDAWAATDQYRLTWLRNNQASLRVNLYKGLANAIANDVGAQLGNLGQRFILPSSYIGGSRFMFQLYQDSIAIARFSGKPDWFLTMTANPNWDEIKSALLPGQSASDRPDLVARVFREKVRVLIKYIKEGAFGEYAGVVYTIEFQKRGFPHIHVLIFLTPRARLKRAEDIDRVISAEIPDPVTHPRLHQLVTTLMIHSPCGEHNPNAPCMKNGKCSKGYPKPFQEETTLSEDGYTLYARHNNGRHIIKKINNKDVIVDNRWVVPHCPRYI